MAGPVVLLTRSLQILEWFAGIGAVAHAVGDQHQIVAAIDINENAERVYRANFSHRWITKEITSISNEQISEFGADTWWISPPCQPFTRRGNQNDIEDRRAQPMLRVFDAIRVLRPANVLLENVIGFENSQAWERLCKTFRQNGYRYDSIQLCSSAFGIPNLRPRFFMVASREMDVQLSAPMETEVKSLSSFLTSDDESLAPWQGELELDPSFATEFYAAIHLAKEDSSMTRCFTSAYGRSIVKSGSYFQAATVRRMSPREVARLLGFADAFCLPSEFSARQLWSLLGNSVSIPCVRHLFSSLSDTLAK